MSSNNVEAKLAPNFRVYRAYKLSHDGRIASAASLDVLNDEDARAIAATMFNGFGLDLWEGERFLACYPPLAVSSG